MNVVWNALSNRELSRKLPLEPISKPNRTNTGFTPSYVRQALTASTYLGAPDAFPRDGQQARAPSNQRWHALDTTMFDVRLFNLAQGLGKPTYGVIFWATTVVNSTREYAGQVWRSDRTRRRSGGLMAGRPRGSLAIGAWCRMTWCRGP